MKNIYKNITALGLGLVATTMVACNDFEEINVNPYTTTEEAVLPQYLLTSSIFYAQQDPHIHDRIWLRYWNRAARFGSPGVMGIGAYSDDWTKDYLSLNSFGLSNWINNATLAIRIAEQRMAEGKATVGENNILQISRIWRAYLYSEYADNFGPSPLEGFQGTNPLFSTQKETYEFMISELADAVTKLDANLTMSDSEKNADLFFKGDLSMWVKYANSMRMRFAMRISSAAPAYAQEQFELAAADLSKLITEQADIPAIQEGGGWDATTGVMTRSNYQSMSLTMANLTMGLGGVDIAKIGALPETAATGISAEDLATYSKDPSQYLGLKHDEWLSDKTNVNNAAYLMDYMPSKIDPRALVGFSIPVADDNNPVAWAHIATEDNGDASLVPISLTSDANSEKVLLRAEYTYYTSRIGNGGVKSTILNQFAYSAGVGNVPHRGKKYRNNEQKRVFFGPWETYFLIAEAAVKGWATPMSAEAAYEAGIASSFVFNGVESLVDEYLQSEDYNMIGTSVKFSHTSEITSRTMQYYELADNLVDAGEDADGNKQFAVKENPTLKTVEYKFPKGVHPTNNDALSKIMTQKYIAQSPWLPSEAWADYRRLCLPFFENPLLEVSISTMPNYSDYTTANPLNCGQRVKYPSNFLGTNEAGYVSAIGDLQGGIDDTMTPLWWSYGANN